MTELEKIAKCMYERSYMHSGRGWRARKGGSGWFRRSSLPPWCVVVVLVPSSFASPSPSPVRRSPFRYPSLSAAGTSLLVGGSSSVGRCGCVRWVVASL